MSSKKTIPALLLAATLAAAALWLATRDRAPSPETPAAAPVERELREVFQAQAPTNPATEAVHAPAPPEPATHDPFAALAAALTDQPPVEEAELADWAQPFLETAATDPDETFRRQHAAVHNAHDLPATAAEASALLAFLRRPPAPGRLGPHLVLANEILSLLRHQPQLGTWTRTALAALVADDSLAPELRGYAIQHLSLHFEETDREEDRPPIRDLLLRAARHPHPHIAGTGILALERLSALHPDIIPPSDIHAPALRLAADGEADALARTSAIQVCAKLGVAEALPLARELAAAADTIPLRLAAINALGDLGGQADIDFLSGLHEGPEPRCRVPARTALARISTRQGNETRK